MLSASLTTRSRKSPRKRNLYRCSISRVDTLHTHTQIHSFLISLNKKRERREREEREKEKENKQGKQVLFFVCCCCCSPFLAPYSFLHTKREKKGWIGCVVVVAVVCYHHGCVCVAVVCFSYFILFGYHSMKIRTRSCCLFLNHTHTDIDTYTYVRAFISCIRMATK